MTDWQPIETAPKDRVAVLLYCFFPDEEGGDDHGHDMQIGFWGDLNGRWVTAGSRIEPTHWMPLPSPPGVEDA